MYHQLITTDANMTMKKPMQSMIKHRGFDVISTERPYQIIMYYNA